MDDWPFAFLVVAVVACISALVGFLTYNGFQESQYIKVHNQQIIQHCLDAGKSPNDCRQLILDNIR